MPSTVAILVARIDETSSYEIVHVFLEHQKTISDPAGLRSWARVMLRQPEFAGAMIRDVDLLETDPVTGRRTGLAVQARRALRALTTARVPYAVVGAAALAARGLPRMTKDLDVVVLTGHAFAALDALAGANFRSMTPVNRTEEPEPMYVLQSQGSEVDLLVAAGEPEATVVAEATPARVFGTTAPVATLEHLVLMYLYSNQPRHLGDLARIVTETKVNLREVERFLEDVHPEMLAVLHERVRLAKEPLPAPPRPKRR